MNLAFSEADEAFRIEVRTWLAAHLGQVEHCLGRGGLGDMDAFVPERIAWEKTLGEGGWIGLGWPEEHGGRGASLYEEVIFNEEYARARAPGRAGHIGETLLGPTLIHFGTPDQQARYLPPILTGEALWCQGYSEPNAGSDLAGLSTRAVHDGGGWRITGQKVWTSLAHVSDWCFVLARTDPTEPRHQGISCLLVPMKQPGVEVVPIHQMTGTAEFCEVFFDDAVATEVVGPVNGGWKVAMGTLAFERGASTLGQQLAFQAELDRIIAVARETGAHKIPAIRDRIADLHMRLQTMRHNALRILSGHAAGTLSREALITKLYWSHWHRDAGELAMDVLGQSSAVCDPAYEDLHRLFLWSRADTIYAGTSQIQRTLIAERGLKLPKR